MGKLAKEISLAAGNQPGTLAKVAGCLKEAGVSIQAACAWGEGAKATFWILVDNNPKATDALKKAGYAPEEREVVTTRLANRVGSLAEATQKLGQAGVDIDHCYMSALGTDALAIFATKDNKKAAALLL